MVASGLAAGRADAADAFGGQPARGGAAGPSLEPQYAWRNTFAGARPTCDHLCVTYSMRLPRAAGNRIRRTFGDVGSVGRDVLWQLIRAERQSPPGRANKGERRKVFCSALEQAEHLFTASAAVDHSARPILLFYGLSQAGRAIAAASVNADSHQWRLSKHGIEVPNLAQKPPLHELTVIDQGWGSFTQLAALLNSGSLPKGALLGDVWATIPDIGSMRIGKSSGKPALLFADYYFNSQFERRREMTGWIRGIPWQSDDWPTEDEISEYLNAYPTLAGSKRPGFEVHETDPDAIGDVKNDVYTRMVEVRRVWPMPPGIHPEDRRTFPYRGDDDRWAFPTLGGCETPLHPLLAWWAMLFTLSMLARYEPSSWTEHLDVDTSANAVPLETALERALDTCPELILQAIRRTNWQ